MKVIGVTGGIGSGKSTVSRILHDLGAKLIDADKIARLVVGRDGSALGEVTAYFGNDVLSEDGELDRKKLGDMVFNNTEKLKVLNSITHRYVAEEIMESVDNAKKEGRPEVIVIGAPIPIEHGFIDVSDEIWVVTVDREVRIARIMKRDGFTYDEAVSRINSQMKDEDYLKIANEIINNNEGIEELEKTVVKLFIKTQKLR